jgi:hypothetical protein
MIDPMKQSNVSIVLRKKSNHIVIFLTREGGLTSFESVSLILRQSSFVESAPHSDLIHLDITSATDTKVTAKVTAKLKAGAIGIFRLEHLSAYQRPVYHSLNVHPLLHLAALSHHIRRHSKVDNARTPYCRSDSHACPDLEVTLPLSL